MRKEANCLYGTGFNDFDPCQLYRRKRISVFIIGQTIVQTGRKHIWILIAIEPAHKSVIGSYISEERNMFVAKYFIRYFVDKYGKHTVYKDGGTRYSQAWTFFAFETWVAFSFGGVVSKE